MGYVYLYTGLGGGKTTNALGLALRCVGHGKKVVVVQFCKWSKDTGEVLIQDKLAGLYEIYQFGRKAWLGTKDKTVKIDGEAFKIEGVTQEDKALAQQGLELALKVMLEREPYLLVLDEVNLAAHWKLVAEEAVLDLLSKVPEQTTVVLTGRYAPKSFIDRADFVNFVEPVKMPKTFTQTKGIQY
ncbi:MAG: cob(I)yrinic acid a,c-diamide adenosyltransferase [Candidatus Bathyarchaeota archaeon]|nr:cob(I)yrinic acid a,c-diamide adenosyltransferase [Candidatus Bathyarchaeota archaeon]